jgi:hypothetical protein
VIIGLSTALTAGGGAVPLAGGVTTAVIVVESTILTSDSGTGSILVGPVPSVTLIWVAMHDAVV